MNDQDRRWVDYIVESLERLGGAARLDSIYREIEAIREESFAETWEATVRWTLQKHSSDSKTYDGKDDRFYSVEGLGGGVWGLRAYIAPSPAEQPEADVNDIFHQIETLRQEVLRRPIRDTRLSLALKGLYGFQCQICSYSITLSKGRRYCEVHHIKPFGRPHNGPDDISNMICVCPNHHTALDYGAMQLDLSQFRHLHPDHKLDPQWIRYHNDEIYKG